MSKRHNPEKRAWRGRSYKKGGAQVRQLREDQDDNGCRRTRVPRRCRGREFQE